MLNIMATDFKSRVHEDFQEKGDVCSKTTLELFEKEATIISARQDPYGGHKIDA